MKIHIENPNTEEMVLTSIGKVPIYKSYCGKYQSIAYCEDVLLKPELAGMICKICKKAAPDTKIVG